MDQLSAFEELRVSATTSVTNVTRSSATEQEFVISNEATGRYFLANEKTVAFFTALKDSGNLAVAMQVTGLTEHQAGPLIKRLIENGLVVIPGQTQSKEASPTAPLENKLVSLRWDLFDVQGIARKFSGIGRFAYSRWGYIAWVFAIFAMIFELVANREKVALTMGQVLEAGWAQWFVFAVFFIALKVIHEFGHIFAYRQMCIAENVEPGPIRVGLCIFAFSPFPFTDVTGAWRIRSTRRRLMIGAGGLYFETWAMALLTVFWAQTQVGLIQTVILQVVVVAGCLAIIFNLNPAIKLDGYFILTDFLRRPNLAARSSVAARSRVGRLLGADLPRPNQFDLIYWCLSYAYRWTIFAGIFWIFYRIDPRLAPVAAGIVVLTLIVRPVINTLKFLKPTGVSVVRTGLVSLGLAGLLALALVPVEGRLLVPGQVVSFDTRFVQANVAGQLKQSASGWVLENQELDQRITDASIQEAMLQNLKRASFASAQEQARITTELEANNDQQNYLRAQRAKLDLLASSATNNSVWTELEASRLEGAWVLPGQDQKIGAISEPVQEHLLFRLDQSRLLAELALEDGTPIIVRSVANTDCEFDAYLSDNSSSLIAVDGVLYFKARVTENRPFCAGDLPHGSGLVARLKTGRASFLKMAWLHGARALQERLPAQ